ncbi:hypothetical protein FM113_16950 [Leucobacter sp. 7(1)]|uniref:MepB family protein n=1 Tax=Leucobacter sp. 7(1) TaxID=1255613 RepID=UPI00097EFA9E|nr:MepB family protein [Leucobacter sp. 7(1)]SJN13154.1 hypothetical protein FM113_16950 [Leucobacter sp. 7(1)]
MNFTAFERFATLPGVRWGTPGVPTPEEQNSEYESGAVRLGDAQWRIRTARITPTKPGAFVAVWQRNPTGATEPFGADDPAAGLLVFVVDEERFGVFKFTTAELCELGVSRSAVHPGKRGFRVYPAWSTGLNRAAARTQAAQAAAFHDLGGN